MQVQAVIDRFEGNKAVLLVGKEELQVVWPREYMSRESAEGDILQIYIEVDEVATAEAKAEGERLLKEILGKE